MAQPQLQGTLKFYNLEKCFGFILPHLSGQPDVFFHKSELDKANIAPPIPKGAAIRYDLVDNPRTGKLCAVNLKLD